MSVGVRDFCAWVTGLAWRNISGSSQGQVPMCTRYCSHGMSPLVTRLAWSEMPTNITEAAKRSLYQVAPQALA